MLRIKDDTFCNICLLCRRNTRDVMNCYRCLYQKMEYTQICDNSHVTSNKVWTNKTIILLTLKSIFYVQKAYSCKNVTMCN